MRDYTDKYMYLFYIAQAAGFERVSLVPEPTAALIAHVKENQTSFDTAFKTQNHFAETWAVVDCGGGTTDFCKVMVRASEVNQEIHWITDVKKISGCRFLGGTDFTQAICNIIVNRIQSKTPTIRFSKHDHQDIYERAEEIKKILSSQSKAHCSIRFGERYSITITREEFELSIQNLKKQFAEELLICIESDINNASDTSNKNKKDILYDDIDRVLIVGGSGDCQFITKLVYNTLPTPTTIETVSHPRDMVALGAAYVASIRLQKKNYTNFKFHTVSGHAIGIGLQSKKMFELIPSNSKLPFIQKYDELVNSDKDIIDCNIYEGNSKYVVNNVRIGGTTIEFSTPQQKYTATLVLTVNLNINGVLEIKASCPQDPYATAIIKGYGNINTINKSKVILAGQHAKTNNNQTNKTVPEHATDSDTEIDDNDENASTKYNESDSITNDDPSQAEMEIFHNKDNNSIEEKGSNIFNNTDSNLNNSKFSVQNDNYIPNITVCDKENDANLSNKCSTKQNNKKVSINENNNQYYEDNQHVNHINKNNSDHNANQNNSTIEAVSAGHNKLQTNTASKTKNMNNKKRTFDDIVDQKKQNEPPKKKLRLTFGN